MKKVVFLFISVVCITTVNAQKIQERNVPASVKFGLRKQFSDVKNVKWKKEGSNYEAGFQQRGARYSAVLTTTGNLVETEVGINTGALVTPIKDYIAKNYPGQKIREAAKITSAKGTVTYEAEVIETDLIFDDTGKFIKAEKD